MTETRARPWPWRMIVRGAFQDGWSLATQEEKNRAFQHWIEVHRRWQAMGCRLIVTVDDELNMVGQPGARLWNFYSIWEIPGPDIVYDLLNLFRSEEPGEVRLDRYFRLETVVGKPILGLERGLGGLQPPTFVP
ncbi:MAG: hypothetical protein QN174_10325 [Armatimonadota bacterium]|nr:hypothetical protein [Armatimonadota bacterium]MDR7423527.1 hypothetical protein [Armatimonadota bacterium]MDR7454261.1 hypothetical protein [Armatimonadota bacterium]MDR7456789.1 hypothetical protein [Armatimonadota bacterium]MDR7497339.1 hypothetical protein [Armatimonadota bacterium]